MSTTLTRPSRRRPPASPPRRETVVNGAQHRTAPLRLLYNQLDVRIPDWVVDHAAFRKWFASGEFPEEGRVTFLNDEVIFDMSFEQLYSHVRMKTVLTTVLNLLVTMQELGEFFCDGVMISHLGAKVSNNPDGVFVSNAGFESNRVRRVTGASAGFIELEGSPDMVLEVVSDSSVKKDTELLREAYWKADIREYWLVDARGETLEFQILRHGAKGYSPARATGGWLKSSVFGMSFRLFAKTNHLGHPTFDLLVK